MTRLKAMISILVLGPVHIGNLNSLRHNIHKLVELHRTIFALLGTPEKFQQKYLDFLPLACQAATS